MSANDTPLFDVDAESELSAPSLEAIAEAEREAEAEEAREIERKRIRRLLREDARDYATYEALLA